MNLAKAEVKILTLQGIGKELDAQATEARARLYEEKGGHTALVNALEKMQSVFKAVDTDCDNGKFSEFGDPLLVKKLIKEYLLKAALSLENLATQANAAHLQGQGRLEGLLRSYEITKRQWDNERKVVNYQKALENGEIVLEGDESDGKVAPLHRGPPDTRPDGVRPANDLAARRLEARGDPAPAPAKKAPAKKAKGKDAADS